MQMLLELPGPIPLRFFHKSLFQRKMLLEFPFCFLIKPLLNMHGDWSKNFVGEVLHISL